MTDIKKDTLKNQLDDALRQSTNATMFINPDMAVVQLNTIMDEQCIRFAEWIKIECYLKDECWFKHKAMDGNIYSTTELLQIFKQQNGL